jgi:hypothetical protein
MDLSRAELRDRNAVRIARIQSIANPPAPLYGLA